MARPASQAGISCSKEGNGFTHISDAAGLAKMADTLSEEPAIGRLSPVCEGWIYSTGVCFGWDLEEQERSGLGYPYSNFQIEYSRNLWLEIGGQREQVFQALLDRRRAPLDLKTIQTILGDQHRPQYRKRKGRSAQWDAAVERPTYDLTIFKLHGGRRTLKIYTKGQRLLGIEAVAHDTAEVDSGRSLERFPRIVAELRGIVERLMQALSCVDQCFISDETLEQLPAPSQVGKTKVGGIDFNKVRMRHLTAAVIALSASPGGFTASPLAARVRDGGSSDYPSRQAAYDLKKLRGQEMVRRVGNRRNYEPTSGGLRAMAAGSPRQGNQAIAYGFDGNPPRARSPKSTTA